MTGERLFAELNTATMPLSGVSLIEANAGTGKTYSIASLYLRLIVERQLTVDKILVVSFTEAATAELRGRIRERLADLRMVLEAGEPGSSFEHELASACGDRVIALRRVIRALQSFDEAAIFTIHGFCHRLLAESAFEAGVGFESELMHDDAELRQQIVDDFWRIETAQASKLWLNKLLEKNTPRKLFKELGDYFARPLLQRLAPAVSADMHSAEQAFIELTNQLRVLWAERRIEIRTLLQTAQQQKHLHKGIYGEKPLAKLMVTADEWAQSNSYSAKLPDNLDRLSTSRLTDKTNKSGITPSDPVFDAFEQLTDQVQLLDQHFEARLGDLRNRLLDYAQHELPVRKARLRVRHYDDLLRDVYEVLQTSQGKVLRDAAQQKFAAALIDEFQDTDPVQFAIFEGLFCNADTAVIFVGDPKQAIYSFRGADVYAYLDARGCASNFYQLKTNYRSTSDLVDAANKIFSTVAEPFYIDAINYAPSVAHHSNDSLLLDGRPLSGLQFWCLDKCKAGEARQLAADTTASEIAKLLRHAATGSLTRPAPQSRQGAVAVEARDIAVLVRSHKDGDRVRAALSRRGIPSVQHGQSNIYASEEAAELALIMRALADPARANIVRAALATQALGYTAARIDALSDDDSGWQSLLDQLTNCKVIWQQQGFATVLRRLMQEFQIEQQLLALPEGQRRLTNLLHLEDLLQTESSRGRTPDELLSWLDAQRTDPQVNASQAELLRLESDENLVSILTIHFSKGLQFPIVFCPFLWSVPDFKNYRSTALYHDQDNQTVLDLGTEHLAAHTEIAQAEEYAEVLRLNYVALTRAELACFAIWGPVAGAEKSGLAWLLHSQPDERLAAFQARVKNIDSAGLLAPLQQLAGPSISVDPLPVADEIPFIQSPDSATLKSRSLQQSVAAGWRVSSFSALARHGAEQPKDYDALSVAPAGVPVAPTGIFAFPRGARAGRCMHTLFERIAFDDDLAVILPVAGQVLAEHGFDLADAPVLAQMAINVSSTQLYPGQRMTLSDVAPAQRIDEMEFYFPVKALAASKLRSVLGDFGADSAMGASAIQARLETLRLRLSQGFMHGFIDLTFVHNGRYYLVDYKSNWLGAEYRDYQSSSLATAIAKHDYYLQYLIYTVALHRYLGHIKPDYDYDTDFGGVLYLFLRGMHPERGSEFGIYRDRPSRQLIERLVEVLCPAEAVAL